MIKNVYNKLKVFEVFAMKFCNIVNKISEKLQNCIYYYFISQGVYYSFGYLCSKKFNSYYNKMSLSIVSSI
jgi:hypothetical protein